MPNRLLKEGIVDSARIDKLSPEAETLYYRLLVVADDLGRMDARPSIVRSRCFPLKESLSTEKVSKLMEAIWQAELTAKYDVNGQPYIQILEWDQRVRSSGKYPPPDDGPMSVNCPTGDGQLTPHVRAGNARKGLGMGMGKGASNDNDVVFDAETGKWSIPAVLHTQWQGAYPALSLEAELSKAAAWLIANPKNRKSNYARFLVGWFTRSQDRAPRINGAVPGKSDPFAGAH